MGSWPEGMWVQRQGELNLGRGTDEGSSSGQAGLSHSCTLTTLASPRSAPSTAHLACPHTASSLPWHSQRPSHPGLSGMGGDGAERVLHIFTGTCNRAQAARPREMH